VKGNQVENLSCSCSCNPRYVNDQHQSLPQGVGGKTLVGSGKPEDLPVM